MNLLKETIDILKQNHKTPNDVVFVSNLLFKTNWENFKNIANFEYDNGFGAEEINLHLQIVGKDFWLERHEYDGSEWWEFKKISNGDLTSKVFTKEDIICN